MLIQGMEEKDLEISLSRHKGNGSKNMAQILRPKSRLLQMPHTAEGRDEHFCLSQVSFLQVMLHIEGPSP